MSNFNLLDDAEIMLAQSPSDFTEEGGEFFDLNSYGTRHLLSQEAGSAIDDDFFTEAPVYRSIAVPHSMLAVEPATADELSMLEQPAQPNFKRAQEFDLEHVEVTAVKSAPKFTFQGVIVPKMPTPYVLSNQSWNVTATVTPVAILRSLQQAFVALDVDVEFEPEACRFQCAAVVEHRRVLFIACLYGVAADQTCLELQKRQGDSMAYASIYRSVVDALPECMVSNCPLARDSSKRGRTAMCPLPLPTGSDSVELEAGDSAPLLDMATSSLLSLQRDATETLSELSASPANAKALVQDGALAVLAGVIKATADWAVMSAAVTAVSNLVAAVCVKTLTAATEEQMSAALAVAIGQVVSTVAEPKSSMAVNTATHQILKRQCCQALATMTKAPRLSAEVRKQGGMATLLRASCATDAREAAFAYSALQQLSVY